MSDLAQLPIRPARADELASVCSLLKSAALPADDVAHSAHLQFWVAERSGNLVGVVGIERSGSDALLRSLAVAPTERGRGLGRHLVDFAERAARASGHSKLHLLTMSAEGFFQALGYAKVDRAAVPVGVKQTAQFQSLCPASAVCMTKHLVSQSA